MLCYAVCAKRNRRVGRLGPIDQGGGKSGGTGPVVSVLGRQISGPGTFFLEGRKWWRVKNVKSS